MPGFDTLDQVRDQLARAFGAACEFTARPCVYGWVCREMLSAEQRARGADIGQANYVVNRETGVITAHSGLHPVTVGEAYDTAIRAGHPVDGYTVYPVRWEVEAGRVSESPIEYRIRARALAPDAPQPDFEELLIFDERSMSFDTSTARDHPVCDYVAAWVQARRAADGSWPDTGSFCF